MQPSSHSMKTLMQPFSVYPDKFLNIRCTAQSGALDLLISDLSKDWKILQAAREAAIQVLYQDPDLEWCQIRS